MEFENSQSLSLCSSSLPPPTQDSAESFIIVSLISTDGLRYEGVLYHLNLHDSTIVLKNVICYGTEERSYNGFQSLPSPNVSSYIVFSISQIYDVVVKPPVSFTHSSLARGALSSKLSHANEQLDDKQEPTTYSDAPSVNGPVNEGLIHIAPFNPIAQPQYPGSCFYHDPWSNQFYQTMPCGALHQAPPLNAASPPSNLPDEPYASELPFAPQSFFANFPPVPISLSPADGGFEFEALNKNFKQYDIWRGTNNQRDQNIQGSFNMVSRNPFGPIARPVKHPLEISNNLQRRHQLQPPLSSYVYKTRLF